MAFNFVSRLPDHYYTFIHSFLMHVFHLMQHLLIVLGLNISTCLPGVGTETANCQCRHGVKAVYVRILAVSRCLDRSSIRCGCREVSKIKVRGLRRLLHKRLKRDLVRSLAIKPQKCLAKRARKSRPSRPNTLRREDGRRSPG